jgi:hypothetical protein
MHTKLKKKTLQLDITKYAMGEKRNYALEKYYILCRYNLL